jgi:hypothetical protein
MPKCKSALLVAAAQLALLVAGISGPAQAGALPKYDHIIVIFEENKDYDAIVNSANAPYINHTLLGKYGGVSLTNMRAEQHPSQPDYLDFFSGSNQGVDDDGQYDLPGSNPPGPQGQRALLGSFGNIG